MAYDPYGSENDATQPSITHSLNPFSVAGEYFKFKYFQSPGTWSGSKGVMSPLGINANAAEWNKAGAEIYKVLSTKGPGGGLGGALKKAWGYKKSLLFNKDARIGGWDAYMQRSTDATSGLKNEIRNLRSYRGQRQAWSRTRSKIIENQEEYAWRMKDTGKVKGLKKWTREYRKSTTKLEELDAKMIASRTKISLLKEESTRLLKQKGWRTAAKFGIRGMKALNVVGAVMLAVDIGMIIGEPIGRILTEQANQLGTRFEERFMPHMGGKLNMAYMSYGAATERQRAVQAISKAYINGRSAYGSEAAMMHS